MASHLSKTKKRRLPFIRYILYAAACALVTAVILLVVKACGNAADRKLAVEPERIIITKVYAGGIESTKALAPGDMYTLEELEDDLNRFFAGWENSSGELILPSTFVAEKDESFTAVYKVGLETQTHPPYLFAGDDGLFHFEQNLSRADAELMINSLLPEGECFEIEPGEESDPISCSELYSILTDFIPEWKKEAVLSSLTPDDKSITRGETAVLMNGILGRSGSEINGEYVGCLAEASPEDEMYVSMCEACIPHTFELNRSGEVWTAGEAHDTLSPGYLRIGTKLYCVDDNGHFIKNAEVDGFAFDEFGVYTSGDPELDGLVQQTLLQLYSPEYTDLELLRAIYDYVVETPQYLRRDFYDLGTCDYAVEAAKIMLSTWKGNCYNYAAAFCMLTRALGFNANVYSGTVGRLRDRHGWCDITFDGVPYIFDTELQMKVPKTDFFMQTYTQLRRWNYSYRPKTVK